MDMQGARLQNVYLVNMSRLTESLDSDEMYHGK